VTQATTILDFVLRHELTYVARRDAHAAPWIELAQRCFSGHPRLRGLEREIRFAREAAVDEAAAGAQALEYARFLLGLAERVEALRAPHASLVSMADTALERRIEMLTTACRRPACGGSGRRRSARRRRTAT
jgi:beta-lactamase regulating signal transducer with metallopeptidase domain